LIACTFNADFLYTWEAQNSAVWCGRHLRIAMTTPHTTHPATAVRLMPVSTPRRLLT